MDLFLVVNNNNINIHQYYLLIGVDSSSPKSLRKKYKRSNLQSTNKKFKYLLDSLLSVY